MTTIPVSASVEAHVLAALGRGEHSTPHDVLGPHVVQDVGAVGDVGDGTDSSPAPERADPPARPTIVVRTLRPLAESVVALTPDGARTPLDHLGEGVWGGVLPGEEVTDYRLEVTMPGSGPLVLDDPYRYLPTIPAFDLHLVAEGRHEQLWSVLGSNVRRYPGAMGEQVVGTSFAVWAPRAQAVQVIGDFNGWDGRQTMMRSMGGSGVWEVFLPGILAGQRYKYRLLTQDGRWVERADPLARAAEIPPSTASVITESHYSWGDEDWIVARANSEATARPLSIYEVHLGSWRQGMNYRDAATALVEHVSAAGFTHVELMPVAEHPFGGSWGYQVTGYYAPTSRWGSPDELRHLIDSFHQAGIGVILDWVPAHFPKDEWALARFDGEPLYEYPDPRKGEHPDWGTLVPDFGRPQVRNFLVANAVYWLEEFHIDGLRVDAVASMLYLDYSRKDGEWIPNRFGGREHLEALDFLQETNATAYRRVPGIMMIAEESTSWPGVTRTTDADGLGFGFKWNMGWMHDSLSYLEEQPINRHWHHGEMTFAMVYAYSENYVLPISHDEVVHGKGSLLTKAPGDRWQQLASVRAFLAFMWAHPGKQLLFMGTEFAQEREWAESRGLDWELLDDPAHAGVLAAVSDLNRLYKVTPALWELDTDPAGFSWISASDSEHDTFSFIRRDRSGRPLVCVVNFAGVPQEQYRLPFPSAGRWTEALNTDSPAYGGSGVGNLGSIEADAGPWWGQPASASVRIPPLGALWFTPEQWPPAQESVSTDQTVGTVSEAGTEAASRATDEAAARGAAPEPSTAPVPEFVRESAPADEAPRAASPGDVAPADA